MTGVREQQIWQSFADEEYRREFSADIGTGLAFQIRQLREKKGWTQEYLAARTGKQQETISQWENPAYGSYTMNSLKSLAAAFDVALIVKFAPFSELIDWTSNLSPERLAPPSYEEEGAIQRRKAAVEAAFPSSSTWTDFESKLLQSLLQGARDTEPNHGREWTRLRAAHRHLDWLRALGMTNPRQGRGEIA